MRIPYLTLLACALAASACGGDSTDPPDPPEEFDPVPFQAPVARILDGTDLPELAIFNQTTDEIADHFGGILIPVPIGDEPPLPDHSTPTGAFPEFLKGLTYEWDTAADEYDDTAAPGAPIAGVRFLAYEVSGTAFAQPLVEAGYVELEDSGPDGIVGMLAEIDGATQADIKVIATGTLQDGTLRLNGYIGTGNNRVDFDIIADNTVTATGTASSYTGVFEVGGLTSEVESSVDRGPVVTYDTRVTITSPGATVELEGSFDGEGFLGEASVDGVQYATITFAPAADPVVTAADGIVLTAAEEQLFARAILLLEAPTAFIDALLPPFLFPLQVEAGDA